MNEKPFFFLNGNYNLFGILHEPNNEPNGEGFVFCHPFAEEKLWSHRVFVNFARDLAKSGYSILRFDYMGHGDSDGKFEESTIETRLSDIKCAIQTLKKNMIRADSVSLLGLKLGATLAAMVAEKTDIINRLILWDPIINGSTYMKKMIRINLLTQTAVYKEIRYNTDALVEMMKDGKTVNIDGYEISWPLFDQIQKIDLLNKKKYHRKTLIVQISPKKGSLSKSIARLRDSYQNAEALIAIEKYFWKEIREYYYRADNLFKKTLEWIQKT